MALGLQEAFSLALGRNVNAEDGADILGGFRCECGVSVNRVESHVIHGDDLRLRRNVPAFFRLAKSLVHAAECLQNVSQSIANLVRSARAVEDSLDLFEDRRAGFRFRLNIPTQVATLHGSVRGNQEGGARNRVIWSSGRLDNYCRSAVGLAKIWNSIEGSDDRQKLREIVTLVVDGQDVPWTRFCYSMQRYGELCKNLVGRSPKHPIAVLVAVQSLKEKEGEGAIIKCKHSLYNPQETGVRIAPSIYITRAMAANFVPEKQYLVFGLWKYDKEFEWKVPGSSRSIIYHDLSANIYRSAQVAVIDVPGEAEGD